MIVQKIIERRFKFELNEEEGIILRALLNLNKLNITDNLMENKIYWDNILSKEDAIKIGGNICETITELVDEDKYVN